MFESLTAKQIDDIQKRTSIIRKKSLVYTQFIYDVQSTVKIISYKCISELRKANVEITSDINLATKIFAALPMTDTEFLKIKEQYNSDFDLIAEKYCVSANYVKCRYKLALLKKQKLIKELMDKDTKLQKQKRIISTKSN